MGISDCSIEPGYIALYHSGELEARTKQLEARLASCNLCPRQCRVNRLDGETGFCRSGYLPIVSSACAHHGEEPVLSGSRGSGTIFFGNCNMRCVYCQNHQISQNRDIRKSCEVECSVLAGKMLHLQNAGCHNINFVTPSHFVPQILRALIIAIPQGLRIPLVYNTSGYDSLETIKELDGIMDIYLPDLRYASEIKAKKYSQAPDYVASARAAIREMYRQTGKLVLDENGIAQRGVIVRLLILPGGVSGTEESLKWLSREVSPLVSVSLMSQYSPQHHAGLFPEIARTVTAAEYRSAAEALEKAGLVNGWVQELSAQEYYLPDFEKEGHPFEPG